MRAQKRLTGSDGLTADCDSVGTILPGARGALELRDALTTLREEGEDEGCC